MAKKQFKAESKRLLDLMINSIYTHREIFLRELISNASDAIDKLCYVALTDDGLNMSREDFKIVIERDESARILRITDNGIGMTKEDLESNLGTIARSGSGAFKAELGDEEKEKADIDIIGQFGVGFYSAFMVAERLKVTSLAYGADTAWTWESTGADGYTVKEADKGTVGTCIELFLKADDENESYGEYVSEWRLKALIKKYSDYIRWPIMMDTEKLKATEGDTEPEYETVCETVNSMVPIWQRAKSEATDADCKEFYKEKFRDTTEPTAVVRVNAEGNVSYKAMLFVPGRTPAEFMLSDFEPGLQLYSSGVMITEHCAELLNECFYFVRGVVDSPDLSLNISREMLQHDRQLRVISQSLNKKIKSELLKLLENDRAKYEEFYKNFGRNLRYGAVSGYGQNMELVKDLLLFNVSEDKAVSLKEYVDSMPSAQEKIYYAVGESAAKTLRLPQAELVRSRGYDILCLSEEVDEFIIERIGAVDGKAICNIVRDELGLSTQEEKEGLERKSEEQKELLDFCKETLGEAVESVRLSDKLLSAPVCMGTEGEITLEMERYFKKMEKANGMPAMKARRVLELNAEHKAYDALRAAYEGDKERAEKLVRILHAQALIIAGESLEDVSDYTELVCELF